MDQTNDDSMDSAVIALTDRLKQLRLERDESRASILRERDFVRYCHQQVMGTHSIDGFLKAVFGKVLEVMDADRGSIALRSRDPIDRETHFYLVTQTGIDDKDIEHRSIEFMEAKKVHQAIRSQQPLFIHEGDRNSLLMPFGWDQQNEGVICVSKQGARVYSSQDLERLASSAQYLGELTNEMVFRRRILEAEIAFVGNKDGYTQGHSFRVANYAKSIVRRLGLNVGEQEEVYLAGLLHDVGKTAVPDRVLKKRGRLDDVQFEKMKSHAVEGARILRPQLKPLMNGDEYGLIVDGALHHHERYGGNGYPDSLKGEQIPLVGRVLAVADAFDAMVVKRCYRSALPVDQILGQIKGGMGSQFDSEIARAFLQIRPQLAWLDLEAGTYHTPHCDFFARLPTDRFALSDSDRLETLHKTRCELCYARN